MTTEPTRLIHEDPDFAQLVAASEEDGPSPAEVDEAVALARRMASTRRPGPWRWLGSGAAIVGASMCGLFAASSILSGKGATRNAEGMPPLVATAASTASAAPAFVAPPAEPSATTESIVPSTEDPSALAPAATSTVRTDAPRRRPTTSKVSHPQRGKAASAGAEPSTFDEELALLSAARAGLAANDVPASLRAVERYRARFPSGLFAEEIEVIRIEALASSGERASAHALAERFLAANPSSAYAARVRSLAQRTKP